MNFTFAESEAEFEGAVDLLVKSFPANDRDFSRVVQFTLDHSPGVRLLVSHSESPTQPINAAMILMERAFSYEGTIVPMTGLSFISPSQ